MATKSTKSTSSPIGCRTAWIALGADSAYKEGSDTETARNRQLWALNERGMLMLTPEAQAIIDAYSAPKVTKGTKGTKDVDPATVLRLIEAGFTKDEALAMAGAA